MRTLILWLVLVAAIAVGTALWGLAVSHGKGAWWRAALAGSCAWALLLAVAATQGPVSAVAHKVGAVFSLPAFAFVFLNLLFPALLAGSAAELAGAIRNAGLARRGPTG